MVLLAILSALLLLLVAWFDFKDRSVPVILIIIEVIVLLIYFTMHKVYGYYCFVGVNLLIGALQVGIVALWLKIKKKELSFFKDAFGWGDVLMMGMGAFFFTPIYYVLFVLVATLISLVYAGVTKLFFGNLYPVLIPMAGLMALLLFVIQVIYIEGFMFLTVGGTIEEKLSNIFNGSISL